MAVRPPAGFFYNMLRHSPLPNTCHVHTALHLPHGFFWNEFISPLSLCPGGRNVNSVCERTSERKRKHAWLTELCWYMVHKGWKSVERISSVCVLGWWNRLQFLSGLQVQIVIAVGELCPTHHPGNATVIIILCCVNWELRSSWISAIWKDFNDMRLGSLTQKTKFVICSSLKN